MTPETKSPYAPIRRVVTDHIEEGKAVVVQDSTIAPRNAANTASAYVDLFWTDEVPADITTSYEDKIK